MYAALFGLLSALGGALITAAAAYWGPIQAQHRAGGVPGPPDRRPRPARFIVRDPLDLPTPRSEVANLCPVPDTGRPLVASSHGGKAWSTGMALNLGGCRSSYVDRSGDGARHRLGVKLRELREARSLRLEDVAANLGVVPSTLSRIETGKAPTRRVYLASMLAMYGVDDPDQTRLLASLARDGGREEWWAVYADLLPDGVGRYMGIEAAASLVRSYATQIVPALLQTRDYASAACRAARPGLTADQARALGTVTMRRREIVRDNLARLHLLSTNQPCSG